MAPRHRLRRLAAAGSATLVVLTPGALAAQEDDGTGGPDTTQQPDTQRAEDQQQPDGTQGRGREVPPVNPGEGPLLGRGSVGPAVSDHQQQLNVWREDAGLDPIAVDGIYGVVTESATRQFQAARDALQVDGLVGPRTRFVLAVALQRDAPPEQPTAEPPDVDTEGPLLGIGSVGPEVAEWQQRLNTWRDSIGVPPIAVDGIYGPVTEDATRQFQAAMEALRVDGIVGPNTRAVSATTIGG